MEKRNYQNCRNYGEYGCVIMQPCHPTHDENYGSEWLPIEPKNCETCQDLNCNSYLKGE